MALATGASYGISNVLLSKLEENDPAGKSSLFSASNKTEPNAPFIYTIDANEASWIGECKKCITDVRCLQL